MRLTPILPVSFSSIFFFHPLKIALDLIMGTVRNLMNTQIA